LKFANGLWNTAESFLFHITVKNQLREIIEGDPDHVGSLIDKLSDLPVNERLAMSEPGDGGHVKGEDFLFAMLNNYKDNLDKYLEEKDPEKREKVKKGAINVGNMGMAVYRNDSAYFERLGGMVTFLVNNVDKLKKIKNVDQEHSAILEGLYRWWKVNDKRLRSKLWIEGAFLIAIKKYKTDLFYRRSMNMCLIFIANNAQHWKDDEAFNPNNWFPKRRGKFCNAMFGWRF